MEYHPHIVNQEKTLELLNNEGTSKSSSGKAGNSIQTAILGKVKDIYF
jgi:uncharacterized protein YrrD